MVLLGVTYNLRKVYLGLEKKQRYSGGWGAVLHQSLRCHSRNSDVDYLEVDIKFIVVSRKSINKRLNKVLYLKLYIVYFNITFIYLSFDKPKSTVYSEEILGP